MPADSVDFRTNIASGVYLITLTDSVQVPCFTIDDQEHEIRSGDITLRVKLDSLANLTAEAVTKEKELQMEIIEKDRIIRELTEKVKVYEKEDSAFSRTMKTIGAYLLVFLVLAAIIAGVIRKFFSL